MDAGTVAALISIGLSVAALFFGVKYKQLKDLLKTIIAAAEDDEVSEAEFQDIVAQAKALMGKSEG